MVQVVETDRWKELSAHLRTTASIWLGSRIRFSPCIIGLSAKLLEVCAFACVCVCFRYIASKWRCYIAEAIAVSCIGAQCEPEIYMTELEAEQLRQNY